MKLIEEKKCYYYYFEYFYINISFQIKINKLCKYLLIKNKLKIIKYKLIYYNNNYVHYIN